MSVDGERPSWSDYWASVETFCELCQREFPDRFVSCIVVGSMSVGDTVPGWSDVDAYIVVDVVTDELRRKVSGLVDDVTGKFPWYSTDRGSMFSVLMVARRELFEGSNDVSFLSQWDIKRHGILACGEDLRPLMPDPELDRGWISRHIDWMHTFLAGERESPPYWKARNAIGFILNGARDAILTSGAYAKAKEEIAQRFERMYPDWAGLLRRAMDARAFWPQILERGADVDAIYEQALGFLDWMQSLP